MPKAIRVSEMNKVGIFLSAEDKEDILASYSLIDDSSSDYETYLETYPVLADEPIYVLNDIERTEIDRHNPAMAKALLDGIEH